MTATRTLVVWCPDWPVTAAGVDPATPAAVLHANRVVACSAAARAEGVRRGLRRREAQARCPHLLVLEHDPSRDARAFEPVVAAVEALAPGVEVVRPGLCAVATRGPSRYFGGDEALAERMVATVGAGSRVGIADGVFAATLAARQSRVITPGASAAFLAPFSVRELDRPDLADLLVRLGITTLGGFAALPTDDVVARFGSDGALAHRLARGLDERPPAGRIPAPDFTVQAELDPPALQVEPVAFVAKSLADHLDGLLRSRGLACTRIGIEAQTEHGETLTRLWRSDRGLTSAAVAQRVRWQLDGWLAGSADEPAPTAGLTLLRLVPDQVVRDTGTQRSFEGGDVEADERAARALARVQGMLGADAVVTAVPAGGRIPQAQAKLIRWGDPRDADATAAQPWPGRVPEPSPATVQHPPVPVEVTDRNGDVVGVSGRCEMTAPPARLAVPGQPPAAISAWAGPWPLEERWWDPATRRRQARFQAVTADGTACLLALDGGRWWLQAEYD